MEEVFAQNPGDPEVAAREKHGYALTGHEMGPTVLATLADDGVNPGVARAALLPRGEKLLVCVPRELDAQVVPFHDVELWRSGAHKVGKVAKEEVLGRLLEELLATRGDRGKLLELAEHLASRETSESKVGTEGVLGQEPASRVVHGLDARRPVPEESTERLCLSAGPGVGVQSLAVIEAQFLESRDAPERWFDFAAGRECIEDAGGHREVEGFLWFTDSLNDLPEQLVGDRDLAVVGRDDIHGVVEGVAEKGIDVYLVFLTNRLHDAVVVHRLVAGLRGLESERLHVPLLEDLREEEERVAHQDVQTCVEGNFLQLKVQVVERFQEEPPDVDAGTTAVVPVEPRVDDKDGTEPHAVGNGLGESRVVVEAQGVQSEPVERRRGLCGLQRRARSTSAGREDHHLAGGGTLLLLLHLRYRRVKSSCTAGVGSVAKRSCVPSERAS